MIFPEMVTERGGGGTAISGGGTPDTGGGTPFQPVPAEFNHCGALQQTVYHHQSVFSVVELKTAIVKAWQKRSHSSTKCR